jgi:Proteobacterial transcriptional regulator-like domain
VVKPEAEWRSPAAYEDLRSLDAPGFAWEFLRRNRAFQQDRKRLEQAAERGALSADEADAFARRWGVRFPGAEG